MQKITLEDVDTPSGALEESYEYLLLIIDDYSRYPMVEIVESTAAPRVIPKFDKVFSLDVVRSDN